MPDDARPGPERPNTGALAGMRIVDLTTVIMGPLATRQLGDHGAEVIRIESLEGDTTRNSPPSRHPGMSATTMNLHRNKRSVALDLKHPDGLRAASAIVASADAVVTNMRRAALDRLGLGPAALRAAHPGLVVCVANGYGSDGPYADRPAYDDAIQAASGSAWLMGRLLGEPRYLPTIVADKVVGMAVAQAVLVALIHKLRTGEGQLVEVPMFETMVAFNLVEHQRGATFEPPLGPVGHERVLSPTRTPYRTADGWIGVLPYTDRHWRDVFLAAGRPDLAEDPRFAGFNNRLANIDEAYRLLEELCAERTTAEWLAELEARSVPAMAVLDLERVDEDPHLRAVGLLELVEHPSEGPYRHVRDTATLDRSPSGLFRFAPRVGEHTSEVLSEIGWSTSEIGSLLAAGAGRQAPDATDR
jgi:crotonobetainyl-CoA:carnitine CoA-transferase CaiB-like acyl-CoA transferase